MNILGVSLPKNVMLKNIISIFNFFNYNSFFILCFTIIFQKNKNNIALNRFDTNKDLSNEISNI